MASVGVTTMQPGPTHSAGAQNMASMQSRGPPGGASNVSAKNSGKLESVLVHL
jgi:hypothetical protein